MKNLKCCFVFCISGIFNNAGSNLRLRTIGYINLEGLKGNGHILIEGRALSVRVFIGRIEENHEKLISIVMS
jgi:hypothetical protein